MNIKNFLLVTLVVITALPGSKLAAGTNNLIELTDESGTVGGQVMIEIIWTNSGNPTQTLQFDMLFDDSAFTFDSCPLNNPGDWVLPTCQVIGPGEVRLGLLDPDNLPNLTVATLILDVNGPAGMYQVTVEGGSIVTSDGEMTDTNPSDLNITDVPSPTLGSSPQNPGETIDFGDHGTADPDATAMLTVSNVGAAEPLQGECTISDSDGGVFTLAGDPVVGDLDIGEEVVLTLTCVTEVVGSYAGELRCDHNGSNDPSTWPLVCDVTPVPTYDSTPPPASTIPMNGTQGNGDAMASLVIDNDSGEMGSTLTGTCGLAGDPQISISGSAAFSVLQGATDSIDLACDDALQDFYTSTLTCTANDPATNAGPFTYDVECTMGPPDPGVWGSNPPSGGTIDLTPGGPEPVGTDLTGAATLEVFNAGDSGDEDIDYNCTIVGGDTEISQSPDPALGTLVAGGASDFISYSCDTTSPGDFSATVECAWSGPFEGPGGGVEMYTVNCDVREAFSDVVETPPSGTPQIAEIGPGESITGDFNFEEVLGEGLDGSLDTCSLATGTDFQITTSTVYPQVIPSGGPPVLVQVTFTDPGMGDTFTDTLNCTYTENTDGGDPEQVPVSWPLEVTVVGRNATFRVTKDFDDDNPAGVEVFLECNTGLPLQQQAVIHDPDAAANLGPGDFTFIDFVIVDFEPGAMDCDINETVPVGYSESYFAAIGDDGVAGNIVSDDEGCHYEGVESADFICEITNELDSVPIVVNKEWIDDNPEFQLPTFAEIEITCNEPVFFLLAQVEAPQGDVGFSLETFIQPGFPGRFGVFPHWDGSTECTVTETPEAGVLQDVSDCESIPLAPGQGGECTIVNTRLYAGIPTLSQYGLILMALLMLGVGAVAFRRYT